MKAYYSVILLMVVFFVATLTGCHGMNYSQAGAGIGAGVGAIIGQHIGKNDESTLIGAAIGGLLGYIVGNEMDKYDQEMLGHAVNAQPNCPTSWTNERTGNRYTVTPGYEYDEVYHPGDNPRRSPPSVRRDRRQSRHTSSSRQAVRKCREAKVEAVIDGKSEVAYTKACWNEYRHIWELE